MTIIIAVDGPAASGKGTLAKKLASHFGFHHLDSGALYRLVGLGVAEAHGDPKNEADAVEAARHIDHRRADDPAIRTAAVGMLASIVSAHPAVRQALLDYQRTFAKLPPGTVIDGRDIGTVVCPDATVKLFVDASAEVRAHRRWLELCAANPGDPPDEARLLAEIQERDTRDRTRAVAPLKPADDALLLDTSNLDIDAAFAAALALVSPAVENALASSAKG
jgi:cytidylate kinase